MITVIIRYKGVNGNAKKFVNEMISSRIVNDIRNEEGNLRYEYLYPIEDDESVILIDSWKDQASLDKHHQLPLMKKISGLREKYDLHMEVEKYTELIDDKDSKYIRK